MLKSISENIKLQYVLLFFTVILVYGNTLNHSYVWDDALVIQQNEYTKAGINGIKDIWTKKVYLHNRDVYRPIPQTIFALTYQLSPDKPKLAHIVNILVYGLAVMVTFWFLTLLFSKQNNWLLFFISLLFALHPVHTEVVANIKSLDEILAYLFGILSLSFWVIFLKKPSLKSFLLLIAFFAMALLSKISAITFLAIFLLILYFYYKPFNLNKLYTKTTKNLLKKYYSPKNILVINFLSTIYITTLTYFEYNTFITPIIILLFLTLQKIKNSKLFIFQAIFISSILIIFRWDTSMYFLLLSLSYLLIEEKKITFWLLFMFLLGNVIIGVEFGNYFFLISISLIIYFFHKKNKYISIVFLAITFLLISFSKFSIDLTSLVAILLFIFLLVQKSLSNNNKILILTLFLSITLFVDSSIFHSNTLFYKVETFNVDIINEPTQKEAIIGMSPIHNNLSGETNNEIKYATIAKIQLKYLQLLFFPHPLVHQYGTNQISKTNFKDWIVWFSIIIHLALFLFSLYKLKDKSPVAFGILFYLATISIYTNIVVLMPDTLAERFLFSPSLGFSIALVFALNFLLIKLKLKKANLVLAFILVPILLAFSYKTINRNKAWKNNLQLATQTIKYAPNNAAINAQYATELYLNKGDSAKIINHYKRALEIYPEFYSATKDLANFYINFNPDKAEPLFLKCIKFNNKDWESYYFLAFINYENKKYSDAISYFENSLKYGAKFMDKQKTVYSSEFLARCYFNTNQILLADRLLKEIYTKYQTKSSIVLLANIYHQSGNTEKSLETYTLLLKDFPNDKDLLKTIDILQESLN